MIIAGVVLLTSSLFLAFDCRGGRVLGELNVMTLSAHPHDPFLSSGLLVSLRITLSPLTPFLALRRPASSAQLSCLAAAFHPTPRAGSM